MTPTRHTPAIATVLAALILGIAALPTALDAENGIFRSPSRTVSLFVLPGETVTFDLSSYAGLTAAALDRFTVESDGKLEVSRSGRGFSIETPDDPGIYGVRFRERMDGGLAEPAPYWLHVVVLRPASEVRGGLLNGYPVGSFPEVQATDRWRFEQPRGFVEITAENGNTRLTDHILLKELDCKLPAPYPHYAVVHTSLLVKLEGIADALNQRGLPGDHIQIMSGFRTPDYNRMIGNETSQSRHIAGDAADIFVDRNRDGRMDDLNRDGRINRADSRYLLAIVDRMDQSPEYGALVGGASAYRATSAHGPFVHVDTRGYPARW